MNAVHGGERVEGNRASESCRPSTHPASPPDPSSTSYTAAAPSIDGAHSIAISIAARSGLWFGARFTGFSGNRGLFLEQDLVPIYQRDPADTLRYRTTIELDRDGCLIDVPGAVVQSIDADTLTADFTFTELARLAEGARLAVTATCGSTTLRKSALVQLGLVQAGLTIRSADVEWSRPVCADAVADCVIATSGADLGACGSYREVHTCIVERGL